MDSRLQNANYYIPKAKIPYRPIPSYYLAKDVKKVNDSCPLTQSYQPQLNPLTKLKLYDLLSYKQKEKQSYSSNRLTYYKAEQLRNEELNKTQPKIAVFQNQGSTQKPKRYSKPSKSFNNSTPVLNKSVSHFTANTPAKNIDTKVVRKIKEQKLESLINLIQNNNQKKLHSAFDQLKRNAPILRQMQNIERMKQCFRMKKFKLTLYKII